MAIIMDLSSFPEHLQKSLKKLFSKDFRTPLIVSSKDQINYNINYFLDRTGLKPHQIYFPVKVNHDDDVLAFMNQQNTAFEIASLGELNLLKALNINPSKIIFSNPVKLPDHIKKSYEYGIRTFAFDCISELNKINEFAPGSNVYLRIAVSNSGAEWKLESKFGAKKHDVLQLMKSAMDCGLTPCGIAFHVGWNNINAEAFSNALTLAHEIIETLKKNRIELDFLNIGGGFPAHCCDQYNLIDNIAKEIKPQLSYIRKKYGINIIAEPGSFIVANAAVMICSVVDVIKRKKNALVFLDSGIFQGFQWIMGGVNYQLIYPYKTKKNTEFGKFIITGPSCDSHDVFAKDILLPNSIKSGDLMMIYPAGAYINSAKNYNGFEYPETIMN